MGEATFGPRHIYPQESEPIATTSEYHRKDGVDLRNYLFLSLLIHVQ